MGVWKILLPQTATNFVLNPVAQGAGNYTALGSASATVEPSNANHSTYSGYECYKVENTGDNDGISFTLGALANAIHYVTIRTYGTTTAWDWSLDNSTWNVPTLVRTEGDWTAYGFEFPAAQANGSTTLYVQKNTAGAATWYIGHVQVEAGSVDTTPITGDMKGFCSDGYYWNGAAHASTSTRAGKERKGGLEKDLDADYNFKVMYGVGIGMPPVTHYTQSMALLPGALFEGYKVEPRALDLYSITKASTVPTVVAARKNFINAVKPDRVSPNQPVVFRYYGSNTNKPLEFFGVYDSGMEFQLTSGITDKPSARFMCYDPFAFETHTESALLTTSATSDAEMFIAKINGSWDSISSAIANTVKSICKGVDGCYYMGGAFTNVGDANGDYIFKYNPATDAISSLGGGADATVNAVITAPNGNTYAAGAFTHVHTAVPGDVANTNKIACWTSNSATVEWVTVGGGITCASADVVVNALAFDFAGSLYMGGLFADQADTSGDNITKYTLASATVEYVSLGTGCNGEVKGLATAPNGDIYAVGAFTLAGGVANTAYAGYWDIDPDTATAEWKPLGTGISGGTPVVNTIIFDKAGNAYLGGNFTTLDGVACLNVAKWNGKTAEPLGAGLNNTVLQLAIADNGLIYAVGSYTGGGPDSPIVGVAVWNGSCWTHLDMYFSPIVGAQSVFVDNRNNLFIGLSASGAALTSALNTITNNGTAAAYPVIKIHRANDGTSALVQWLKNETTGDTLWLNHSLQKGETLTIDLTPGRKSIKSDFYGDILRAVLRASDFSTFRLLPGANSISAFVNNNGSTVTAWIEWPLTHWSADGVAV